MVSLSPEALVPLEAVGAALAGWIVVAVYKAWRVARPRPLLWFLLGFVTLALSQFAAIALELRTRAVTEIDPSTPDAFDLLFWTYYGTQLVGFAFLFASFGRRPFRWAAVMGTLLGWAGPVLELCLVAVLFLVVLHAGFNHILRARRGSLQTAIGFFLLLAGHLLFLADYSPLSPRNALGEVAYALGLLLLLLDMARPGKS